MSVIYYPKDSVIYRRDTLSGSYEQVALSVSPNTILYFDTSSNLSSVSSSTIYLTASNALFADTASFAMNGGGGGTTLQTGSFYPVTVSVAVSSSWAPQPTIPPQQDLSSYLSSSITASTSAVWSGTASYAINVLPQQPLGAYLSSSVFNAVVSSSTNLWSGTASFALTSPQQLQSSSVSFATSSLSASFASSSLTSISASYAPGSPSVSASYSLSSSYASTASYVTTVAIPTGSINNTQTILTNFSSSQEATISGLSLAGNNWGANIVEEWDAYSGDLYYVSTSLSLHFSGSNGNTNFIDTSLNPKTIGIWGGTPVITGSNYKFGSSSLYVSQSAISASTSTDFDLGNVHTVELWASTSAAPSNFNGAMILRGFYNTVGQTWNGLQFGMRGLGSIIRFYWYGVSSATEQSIDITPTGSGGWHHYAMSRTGSLGYVFIDGICCSTSSGLNTPLASTQSVKIGVFEYSNTAPSDYFVGYIDEVRVTKGVARYIGNFATASSEFLDASPQTATKYIATVGGMNDSGSVDYGIQKLTDSSLKVKKLSATSQAVNATGSILRATVDRVYVNTLNYNSIPVTSSYAITASFASNTQATNLPVGNILYNSSSWSNLNDFTAVGFTPTIVSNKIHFPTGAGNYSQYLLLNNPFGMDNNWELEVAYTINTSVSYGLIIGKQSMNTSYPLPVHGQVYATHLYISNNTGSNILDITDTGFSSMAAGDKMVMRLKQTNNIITLYVQDITQNYATKVFYKDPLTSTTFNSEYWPNAGQLCIWNPNAAGTIDITSIKVTSYMPVNSTIAFVGDSKLIYGAGDFSLTYPQLISRQLINPTFIFYCGPGDKTTEVSQSIPYLINNLKPKKVILCIGRNDLAFSVPSGTWQANYTASVIALTNAGISVTHMLPIPEISLADQSAVKNFIISTYGYDNCIDPSRLNTGTMIAVDNVHPNPSGHQYIADSILASGQLK